MKIGGEENKIHIWVGGGFKLELESIWKKFFQKILENVCVYINHFNQYLSTKKLKFRDHLKE